MQRVRSGGGAWGAMYDFGEAVRKEVVVVGGGVDGGIGGWSVTQLTDAARRRVVWRRVEQEKKTNLANIF